MTTLSRTHNPIFLIEPSLTLILFYLSLTYSGRGEQSKGGRGAHGFGNVDQEALEAEKDPSSAAPATEDGAEAEATAEPVVEAEPEPGMSTALLSVYVLSCSKVVGCTASNV